MSEVTAAVRHHGSRHETSGISRISDIRHQTSEIWHKTSDIRDIR